VSFIDLKNIKATELDEQSLNATIEMLENHINTKILEQEVNAVYEIAKAVLESYNTKNYD
jgi:hypothetical protein